jgi:hypothetical protein
LCPVIEATFWVATKLPVTRATNIGQGLREISNFKSQIFRLQICNRSLIDA